MNYRTFPGAKERLSILGFGCMRLPLNSDDSSDIDTERAKRMVRAAIDRGVNYIDTAYPYHGGNSEAFVAETLQDGYREKVHLATKLPTWLIETREDMDKYLNEQLERLQTDRIDYYLIHALDKQRWAKITELGLFDFMNTAVSDGRVKYIGFSFHDDVDTFKTIIDAYDWDFCQIQYNYLDTEEQAGTEGLAYAYEKHIGIIVMEPLRTCRMHCSSPAGSSYRLSRTPDPPFFPRLCIQFAVSAALGRHISRRSSAGQRHTRSGSKEIRRQQSSSMGQRDRSSDRTAALPAVRHYCGTFHRRSHRRTGRRPRLFGCIEIRIRHLHGLHRQSAAQADHHRADHVPLFLQTLSIMIRIMIYSLYHKTVQFKGTLYELQDISWSEGKTIHSRIRLHAASAQFR